MLHKILDYITRNRVSTTEVADALGKTGALNNVSPICRGHHKAGKIKWIYAHNESNWTIHEQIQDIEEDCIILVDSFNCKERALFGELVSKYLLLYKQSKAIVVNGKLRDAQALLKENWPIWCSGFTPVGCFNKKPEKQINENILTERKNYYDDAIAVCDDCGVVIIPKEHITEDFLKRLHHMEDQEDIWFDRLDHYKESTFQIVCEKSYNKDEMYMRRRNNN